MNHLKVVLLFSLIFFMSCGGSGDSTTATSHGNNGESTVVATGLKWDESTVDIVVPQTVTNEFYEAIERSVNTWNSVLTNITITLSRDTYDKETLLAKDRCEDNYVLEADCDIEDPSNKLSEFIPVDFLKYLDDSIYSLSFPSEWNLRNSNGQLENDVLAITIYKYRNSTKQMLHADIIFNPNYDFSTIQDNSKMDLETVLTHELGHFLGLQHIDENDDPNSIMNASIRYGQVKRSLSQGDVERVQARYGE